MNLRNKAVLITTSVITASALLVASPALAHKNSTKGSTKSTSKSALVSPTPAPTPPTFGDRRGKGKGHHGKGPRVAPTPITKTVTVDVPATGTYQLLVTEVKPANISPTQPVNAPNRPDHSFTVPVTGTGSQTITLNLPHPGDYTVSLISVVSSQSITVTK
jgi:hypothetical protein